MPDTPPTIHTHIEQDRRRMWHGVMELRYRGRVIYALTYLRGFPQRGRAADMAAQEMVKLEKEARRG